MGFTVVFLFFIQSGESIYDHHDSDLFYDIYNTINEHNRRQNYYRSLIPNLFVICF